MLLILWGCADIKRDQAAAYRSQAQLMTETAAGLEEGDKWREQLLEQAGVLNEKAFELEVEAIADQAKQDAITTTIETSAPLIPQPFQAVLLSVAALLGYGRYRQTL